MRLEKRDRRLYFMDAPFSAKDALKGAGAKWDPDVRAWWMGSTREADAEAIIARLSAQAEQAQAALPAATGPMVAVDGNTYAVRDRLREMGGKWDGDAKTWRVPESRLAAAKSLVSSAPKTTFRHTSCKQCGARPNQRGWPRIYRNGVCSDCYRDAYDD